MQKLSTSYLASLFLILFTSATFVRAENSAPLAKLIGKSRDLSVFYDALKRSGFMETLKGSGPFTVFAPTNAAFKAVDPAALDSLLRNKEELAKIVAYHCVPGAFSSAELKKMDGRQVRSMQSSDLSIRIKKGQLQIDHGKVIRSEVLGKNGVLLFIDTVLNPQPKS